MILRTYTTQPVSSSNSRSSDTLGSSRNALSLFPRAPKKPSFSAHYLEFQGINELDLKPSSPWVFLLLEGNLLTVNSTKINEQRKCPLFTDDNLLATAPTAGDCVDKIISQELTIATNGLNKAGKLQPIFVSHKEGRRFTKPNASYETAVKAINYSFSIDFLNLDSLYSYNCDDDDFLPESEVEQCTLIAAATFNNCTLIAIPYHQLSCDSEDIPRKEIPEVNLPKGLSFSSWNWFGSRTSPFVLLDELLQHFKPLGVYDANGMDQIEGTKCRIREEAKTRSFVCN